MTIGCGRPSGRAHVRKRGASAQVAGGSRPIASRSWRRYQKPATSAKAETPNVRPRRFASTSASRKSTSCSSRTQLVRSRARRNPAPRTRQPVTDRAPQVRCLPLRDGMGQCLMERRSRDGDDVDLTLPARRRGSSAPRPSSGTTTRIWADRAAGEANAGSRTSRVAGAGGSLLPPPAPTAHG